MEKRTKDKGQRTMDSCSCSFCFSPSSSSSSSSFTETLHPGLRMLVEAERAKIRGWKALLERRTASQKIDMSKKIKTE